MALAPAEQERLAKVIAQHVPLPLLKQVVEQHGIVRNFDALLKAPRKFEDRGHFVARAVVKAYCGVDKHHALAIALYKNSLLNDEFIFDIIPFTAHTSDDAGQQAAIAVRANTLRSRPLREFLAKVEAQICLVAALLNELKLGTGFLVGPDLVLTAYHTLRDHISEGRQREGQSGTLWAFFDFYEGEPISDPSDPTIHARRVAFHKDWLKCCSVDLPSDGCLTPAEEDERKDVAVDSLDFALIKLAEPIGLYTRSPEGGARREWIKLDKQPGKRRDDRIIIPQHPNGYPQRIDFGRYSEEYSKLDPSKTRLRYSTETEPGSSGAPCFNQNFLPVGMHNATYKPGGSAITPAIANQAIDLASILPKMRARTPIEDASRAPPPQEPARLWRVADQDVILRRDILLDWIEQAARETTSGARARRVYAAVGFGRNCGKSFTTKILSAARLNTTEPIVEIGRSIDALPGSAKDFIFALAGQLQIPMVLLADFPARPADDLPGNAVDGDKPSRWASEVIPTWFNEVLRKSREFEVDRRAEAREQLEVFRRNNWNAPPEIIEAARAPEPALEKRVRWPLAWITIDRITKNTLRAEVKDVIAGLTGGSLEEPSVPEELRRLRWLFLGYVPDFIEINAITTELLDPLDIKEEDYLDCAERFADTLNWTLSPAEKTLVKGLVRAPLQAPLVKAIFDDPERRFGLLQDLLKEVWPVLTEARQVSQ